MVTKSMSLLAKQNWCERKSVLQGSGLVSTVGPCVQSKVPQAGHHATARDALSNDRRRKRRTFREAC